MSESTATVKFRVPKTVEVTYNDGQGRKLKRPFPMRELIETIADTYPPFSGSPKAARRANRLIAAFADVPDDGTGVADVEASSAEDLVAWAKKPTYQAGREVVERSPLHPNVERASLDYIDAIENPIGSKKADLVEATVPQTPSAQAKRESRAARPAR